MSLWTRIKDALEALKQGESLASVFEHLTTPPERSVGFAIAVIALGAKMAKADGVVTRNEVQAFREIFYIAPEEEANAARIYNLARQDVAGYQAYARQVARMFSGRRDVLCDLLEGLFSIATADHHYHGNEDAFLADVAQVFGIPDAEFQAIRCRFVPDAEPDAYTVLGVAPGTPLEEIRNRWRVLVRENHPDRMMARGVPEEAIKMATKRLTAINDAWSRINEMREPV